jgi:hypothetical protein
MGKFAEKYNMHKVVCGAVGALTLITWAFPVQGQTTEPALELGLMPSTMTVTLLNEGGKYVLVGQAHIPQGGTCRMDKDATIMRVGPGASPETTRVRYVAPQVSAGGCPFLTMFDISNTDYAASRAAFLEMKGEASKKLEEVKKELSEKTAELKKELGEQWDQIFGKKD